MLGRPVSSREISIHALREEGDAQNLAKERGIDLFLSTPSARRATIVSEVAYTHFGISIHALREEGDVAERCELRLRKISIHALREEGD